MSQSSMLPSRLGHADVSPASRSAAAIELVMRTAVAPSRALMMAIARVGSVTTQRSPRAVPSLRMHSTWLDVDLFAIGQVKPPVYNCLF